MMVQCLNGSLLTCSTPFTSLSCLLFYAHTYIRKPYIILHIKRYYAWNWNGGSYGPPNANIGASFTGYVDINEAIMMYYSSLPPLQGMRMLTLGGGNAYGR